MSFAPMSDTGATLLGCLITLTPGTTTVDVDMEQRFLTLHLLDGRDPETAVAGIRMDFERYIIEIFGRG
jgi:multisubunit Na+/H+ antiporter MnhE subunit